MTKAFSSVLASEFEDYVAIRKSAGAVFASSERTLLSLDAFCTKEQLALKELKGDLVSRWVDERQVKIRTRCSNLAVVRCFASYLRAIGIPAQVPESPKGVSTYLPYLFDEDELRRMFLCADNLIAKSPRLDSAAAMVPVLLRILYGTGLRLGEALALRWQDVDLECGVLFIREAKNHRQRYVPISPSLEDILVAFKDSTLCSARQDGSVFEEPDGITVLSQGRVRRLFKDIMDAAGIVHTKTEKWERGVCPHCLRHQFTIHSCLKMEKGGHMFIETAPYLSAYLGHESLTCTDEYLKSSHVLHVNEQNTMDQAIGDLFPEVVYDG